MTEPESPGRPRGKRPVVPWRWPQKERLEILALFFALLYLVYRIDAGFYSVGVSIHPTCKVEGPPGASRVVATVELTGDESLKASLIDLEAPIRIGQSRRSAGPCTFDWLEQGIDYDEEKGEFVEADEEIASLTPGEQTTFACASGPLPAASEGFYTVDVRAAVEREGFINRAIRWDGPKERRATCVAWVTPAPS